MSKATTTNAATTDDGHKKVQDGFVEGDCWGGSRWSRRWMELTASLRRRKARQGAGQGSGVVCPRRNCGYTRVSLTSRLGQPRGRGKVAKRQADKAWTESGGLI